MREAYDRRAAWYDRLVAPAEFHNHRRAMDAAEIAEGANVLEVACGPGRALVELARRIGPSGRVRGVDLSPRMLERARFRLAGAGMESVETHLSNAKALPFAGSAFDLVYSAYFLDLVAESDFPLVLGEMRRVLRPGGRLVLLNMSSRSETASIRERIHRRLPAAWKLMLMGGCRPVRMAQPVSSAGFADVERIFLGGLYPSEVILTHRSLR